MQQAMEVSLTSSQKYHIYASTSLLNINYFMTVGIFSTIKDPVARQFDLSESFLGLLDSTIFMGTLIGFIMMGVYPLKKPVYGLFVISILLILSMESTILSKYIVSLREVILISSRLVFGILRSYGAINYVILSFYFKQSRENYLIQIWFALGILGDILGIALTEFFLNTVDLDWSIAMTITLSLLFFSVLYLMLAVEEINLDQRQSPETGFSAMADFVKVYWSKGINFLHSIIFILTGIYFIMILWLPYFFTRMGHHATFISIAYPFAYILIIQMVFRKFTGRLFLVVLTLNIILTFFLIRLGDDSDEIPKYIFLILGCSMLSSGFMVFTRTVDLNNRANNTLQILLLYSLNGSLAQIFQIFETYITGVLMQKDLHNIFRVYGVITGLCLLLHIVRMMKYPDSFSLQTQSQQQGVSEVEEQRQRPDNETHKGYKQLVEIEEHSD